MIRKTLEIDRWGDVILCVEDDEAEEFSCHSLGYIQDGRPSCLPEELDGEWDRLHEDWVGELEASAGEITEKFWTYRTQQGF
jgi:hypothetical protein